MSKVTLKFNIKTPSSQLVFACIQATQLKSKEGFNNYFRKILNKLDSLGNKIFSGAPKDSWIIELDEHQVSVKGYDNKISNLEAAIAHSVNLAIQKAMPICNILISPNNIEQLSAIIDAAISTNYTFSFNPANTKSTKITLTICNSEISQNDALECNETRHKIMDSVLMCRDLVDNNADTVTPEYLANKAESVASNANNISCITHIGAKAIADNVQMPLLSTVARGSNLRPVFIHMEYNKDKKDLQHIVLVGKGITYDTGGLNIKTGTHMEDMRKDMAGAATVLASIKAIDALDLNVRVSVIIPSCENSIGAKAYKPGDVYIARSGTSVEIINTDAEGRLVLADALDYAIENICEKNSYLIDVATLTGSILVALGQECAGMFSNSDKLAKSLMDAANKTRETTWRMPLLENLRASLDSKRAKIKNCGSGFGGSITAALFLQHFVKTHKCWAHLDIAGSSDAPKSPLYKTSASGHGVKTLVELASQAVRR
ncbi:MAG: leucyl aminopeptidase family protein [Chlamydiia bacterium]|nr:leucyl aminopeptidase family protein [Chlamydiia bacterium]